MLFVFVIRAFVGFGSYVYLFMHCVQEVRLASRAVDSQGLKRSSTTMVSKTIDSRSFRASLQPKKKPHAASHQTSDCNGKRELFKRRGLSNDSAEEHTCSIDLQLSQNLRDTSVPEGPKEGGSVETLVEKCNEHEQDNSPKVDASSSFVVPTKDAGENLIPASNQLATISKQLKVELENEERSEKLGSLVDACLRGEVPDLRKRDSTALKIMKNIKKKEHKLKKKQKEELASFYKTCDEEEDRLESRQRVESALYRVLYENMPMRAKKLELLSERHSKELDELKRKANENLEDLCARQLDLRNKEEELHARRLKRLKEDELSVSGEVQPDGDDISVTERAASSMLTPTSSSMPSVSDPGDGLQLPLHESLKGQCASIPKPTGVEDPISCENAHELPSLSTNLHSAGDQPHPPSARENHQSSSDSIRTPAPLHIVKPVLVGLHQSELDRTGAMTDLLSVREVEDNLMVEVLPSHVDNSKPLDPSNSVASVGAKVTQVLQALSTYQDSTQDGPISHVAPKHHKPAHGSYISPAASDVPMPSNSNLLGSELEREHVMEEQTHNKHVDTLQASGESSQISQCTGLEDTGATVAGNNGPLQTDASPLASLSEKLNPEAPTEEPVISSDLPATIDPPANKMLYTPAEEVPESCEDNVAKLPSLCTSLHFPEDQPHPQSAHESHYLEASTEEPVASSHALASLDSPDSEMLNTPTVEVPESCEDNVAKLPSLCNSLHLPEGQPHPQSAHESDHLEASTEEPVASSHALASVDSPAREMLNTPIVEVPESCEDSVDVLPSLSSNICLPEDQPRPQLAQHSHQPSLDLPVTLAASLTATPLIDLIQTEVERTNTVRYALPAREVQSALEVHVSTSLADNAVPTDQSNAGASVGEPVVQAPLPIFTGQHCASAECHPSSHLPHGHSQASHGWSAAREASHSPIPSNPNPLEFELERILIVKEQTDKSHANTKLHLKTECMKEMTQVYQKYQVKLQEAEAGFLSKKKNLEKYIEKLQMNKLLAEALQIKFMNPVVSGQPVRQQAFSNIPREQQLLRPFSPDSVRRLPAPNCFSVQASHALATAIDAHLSLVARSSVSPLIPSPSRPSFPAVPSLLGQQEARQRAVFSAAPPVQRVHDSSELFSANPAGSPTPIYSPVLNIQSVNGIRGPAPHLRGRNSSRPNTFASQPWLSNRQC